MRYISEHEFLRKKFVKNRLKEIQKGENGIIKERKVKMYNNGVIVREEGDYINMK